LSVLVSPVIEQSLITLKLCPIDNGFGILALPCNFM